MGDTEERVAVLETHIVYIKENVAEIHEALVKDGFITTVAKQSRDIKWLIMGFRAIYTGVFVWLLRDLVKIAMQ